MQCLIYLSWPITNMDPRKSTGAPKNTFQTVLQSQITCVTIWIGGACPWLPQCPTFIIHLAISINVSFPYHLINFFISQLFSQVSHDMPQLCRTDKTITVLIKNSEGLSYLLLTIGVFHFSRHHCQEFREVNSTITLNSLHHDIWKAHQ